MMHTKDSIPSSRYSDVEASNPLILSIIISNYNYCQFVGAAIESALAQTYPHVEVVCVDDGSTDGSRDIIALYQDRIGMIFKANGGQGSAINEGFRASTGDIIVFLDADDLLSPLCAEAVVHQWRSDYSWLHYGIQLIDVSGQFLDPIGKRIWRYPTGLLINEILQNGGFGHPATTANAFARRYLAEVLPMPADIWRLDADRYLCFLAAFYGTAGGIEEKLASYRVHPSGTSLVKSGRLLEDRWRREVSYEIESDRAIRSRAAALGYNVAAKPLIERCYFLKTYLVWRKICDGIPLAGPDELIGLTVRQIWRAMVRTSIAASDLPIYKKAAYVAWATLVYLAPRRLAERIVIMSDARCESKAA